MPYGKNIRLSIFGTSHGECVGFKLDGIKKDTSVEEEYIERFMDTRRSHDAGITTGRKEADKVEFASGVTDGKADGNTVIGIIKNNDVRSSDYEKIKYTPRPSHADYPAFVKYKGEYDNRGGGAFSGRMTAPLCAAGGIALKILEERGIYVGCHLLSIGNIKDRAFSYTEPENDLITELSKKSFSVIDEEKEKEMRELIEKTAKDGDSVGGVIECKITGMPCGTGEPVFGSIEAAISEIVFAVPGIKGIEFGSGFFGTTLFGSMNNDSYYYDEDGNVKTQTNNSGGICGGLSTGMPIVFKAAVKPTPSIRKTQKTVDILNKKNTTIEIGGRHDACIAVRATAAIRAAAALAILDVLYGAEKDD